METAINVCLQIGRLKEALAQLVFSHVVVADLDCERPNASALFTHFCKQTVRHAPQGRFGKALVREITAKCFLVTKTLRRFSRRNQRTLINTMSKLTNSRRLVSQEQFEHFQRSRGDVANL